MRNYNSEINEQKHRLIDVLRRLEDEEKLPVKLTKQLNSIIWRLEEWQHKYNRYIIEKERKK